MVKLKNFFEEVRIAKEIIENYSEFGLFLKFLGKENTDINNEERIKEIIDCIPKLDLAIKSRDKETTLDDLEKNLFEKGKISIKIPKTDKCYLLTPQIINYISFDINLIKILFIGNFFFDKLRDYIEMDSNENVLLMEKPHSKIYEPENLNIWYNNQLLPLTKEEFYYALRLLDDDSLKSFLSEYGIFNKFYPLVKEGYKDTFIKTIPDDSDELYYWQIAIYFMASPKYGIMNKIRDIYRKDANKLMELAYILNKPTYEALKAYGKLHDSINIENPDHIDDNEFVEILKKQEELFQMVLNGIEGIFQMVNLNDSLPQFVKHEIKEGYIAIAEVFRISLRTIKIDDYSEEEKFSLIKLFFMPAYPMIMALINEKRAKESDGRNTIDQLNRFIKDNFTVSQGYEKKIQEYIYILLKWIDTIKDTKNFYALIFLFFPRITKQGKGGDQLKLMEQRFNSYRMVWRKEPQTQEEVVDLIIKYFPQFRDYRNDKSWSAGAGKQREALEQLKKRPEFSWIDKWQNEIWNPDILIKMKEKEEPLYPKKGTKKGTKI